MSKRRITLEVGGVFGTLAAGWIAGCGSGDTGNAADSGTDATSRSDSGSSSSGGQSSSSSGAGSSSGGSDRGDAGDSGLADADAGSACVTSAILTADGGTIRVGDGGAQLLYAFDNGQVPNGWGPRISDPTDSGLTSTLTANTTDGHTCPGALQLTTPFTAFGQVSDMLINPSGTPYRGTQLHLWAKVVIPGDAGITVGQEFLQGNGQVYAQWRSTGVDASLYSSSDFVNFYPPQYTSWKEVLLPIVGCGNCTADAGPTSIDLGQLGANLLPNPQDAAPPTTAVLLLDDIWLE